MHAQQVLCSHQNPVQITSGSNPKFIYIEYFGINPHPRQKHWTKCRDVWSSKHSNRFNVSVLRNIRDSNYSFQGNKVHTDGILLSMKYIIVAINIPHVNCPAPHNCFKVALSFGKAQHCCIKMTSGIIMLYEQEIFTKLSKCYLEDFSIFQLFWYLLIHFKKLDRQAFD